MDYKDAAVGNYVILQLETYYFQQKWKLFQEKEQQNRISGSEVKSNSPKKFEKILSDEFIWKYKLQELKKYRLRKPYELTRKTLKKRKRKHKSKSTVKPIIDYW